MLDDASRIKREQYPCFAKKRVAKEKKEKGSEKRPKRKDRWKDKSGDRPNRRDKHEHHQYYTDHTRESFTPFNTFKFEILTVMYRKHNFQWPQIIRSPIDIKDKDKW